MKLTKEQEEWLKEYKQLNYLKTDEEAIDRLISFYKAWNNLIFELKTIPCKARREK